MNSRPGERDSRFISKDVAVAKARDLRGPAAVGLVLAAIAVLVSIGTTGVGGAAAAYYYYCPNQYQYQYCPPVKASPTLTTSPDPVVGPTGAG